MICKKCGKENKYSNIKCDFCGTMLIDENEDSFVNNSEKVIERVSDIQNKVISTSIRIKNVIVCIVGISMILIGTPSIIFGTNIMIAKNNGSLKSTTANFKEYHNCQQDGNDDESCIGTYEYQVNGKTYTFEENNDHDDFVQTQTIYYYVDDPGSTVQGDNNLTVITGIIFVLIGFCLIIFRNKVHFNDRNFGPEMGDLLNTNGDIDQYNESSIDNQPISDVVKTSEASNTNMISQTPVTENDIIQHENNTPINSSLKQTEITSSQPVSIKVVEPAVVTTDEINKEKVIEEKNSTPPLNNDDVEYLFDDDIVNEPDKVNSENEDLTSIFDQKVNQVDNNQNSNNIEN